MTVLHTARFVPAVLAALALAACGGSDDDPPPPAAAPTAVGGATQVAPPVPADPAWLAATTAVATLPRSQVDAQGAARGWAALAGPARCDVAVHSIRHATVGPEGEATDATGAVFVPGGEGCAGPYPVLSYSRGTDLDRDRSMANVEERETQAVIGFFAARGWVVVASDYLGYAGSSFPVHPYLDASSVARTDTDALRAGRALLARLGVAESGRLALAGYSQGGHAALATARALERGEHASGLPVPAAIGAMSGPYDLAGSFPEVARLLPLLSVSLGSSAARTVALRLGDLLGTSATDLLASQDRLRTVLQANSVIGWTPRAPVLLCGGSRDPVVPFSNTTRAAADFASRGAAVTVVDVEQDPAYRPLLPPAGVGIDDLGSYHQGAVPPACFQAVRDRLLEPLR